MAKINDPLFHIGHRERLRQKRRDGKATNSEMLELVLCNAIPRRDLRPLARNLMHTYGGIHQILAAPEQELCKFPGMGPSSASLMKDIYELMKLAYEEVLRKTTIFHDEKVLHNYCRTIMINKTVEEFHAFYLDENHRLLKDIKHSSGDTTWSPVSRADVVRAAVELKAKYVVLLHNHPNSCVSQFSRQDQDITLEIRDMLKPFGIGLLDHILIVNDFAYSALNQGLLQ